MEAKLLNDRTRLQEIYDLRVAAYEKSPYSKYVNKQNYPNGYFDDLDPLKSTLHWVVEDGGRIVGSVRAAVLPHPSAMLEDISQLNLPNGTPFAYCGRTVVHPDYRTGRTMLLLDHALKSFIARNSEIKYALCFVTPERMKAVTRLGFRKAGSVQYEWGNGVTTLVAFVFIK